ncbi:FIG023677: hypothetical protein [uncultured Gammaproteobacteria bacterium]|uniref:DUF692 domain-containing protein n=1 Tax=Bathymodiolus heckerae thiotrophic gill symbiont TaxID=1052212 RepID=UPI0010B20386|nr:DUF692 domain-containing protein [Bathymodiolus heckerae thiotrophic gill symbiont]CAC9961353.1 FIG023677: hypothetical protein [uncultured Gammaproteobacteria bacterium]SHN90705.1 FIG023677: hypothetical protein [Bathymodiolus heckerae thiotrophic gill symbiont]
MNVGLAYKRSMGDLPRELVFDYLEVAPENWIGKEAEFETLRNEYSVVLHGLSLSIGSVDPLDKDYIQQIKSFMDRFDLDLYTEHLSFCSYKGHLYDLMPLPFTKEAVNHTVDRINQVQDILQRRIALENVSYYGSIESEMSEMQFINDIAKSSGSGIMLDVNNIFVNSVNHGNYTPSSFIDELQGDVLYYHNAGHYWEKPDLIIDSHGDNITEESMQTLKMAYQKFGVAPTTIERDFNIPPIDEPNKEAQWVWKTIKDH